MKKNGLDAYRKTEQVTSSGRKNEARVLIEGAIKLKQCQENWARGDHNLRLQEALKYNQKIWSVFQAELTRKDNSLPKEVRLNLLRLSFFIDKQIFKVMAFPDPEKLTAIIQINMGIAESLKKKNIDQCDKIAGIQDYSV